MTPGESSAPPAVGPAEPASKEVASFAYQMRDAYLYDASLVRSDGEGPDRPTFATSLETQDRDELPGFIALLTVRVEHRFRPGAVCTIQTRTAGVFRRTGELDAQDDSRFRQADCAVLLWPFARAMVAEIARMAGVDLPPLPTVDVRVTLENLSEKRA